jgi:signal transduction histidine kinase/CheY-like chemotaxis protein
MKSLDISEGRDFLVDFRSTGLKWAFYAGIAASSLFFVFILLDFIRGSWDSSIIFLRSLVAVVLLLLSIVVRNVNLSAPFVYPCFVGIASSVGLFGASAIASLAEDQNSSILLSVPIAFIFGLFLHYSFLRLPLPLASLIGWSAAASALILTPSALGGDSVRHATYLVFSNIFGMFICYLMESRERELFRQRRSTEAAWIEARRSQAQAESLVAEKGRLIAAVSHDLRQPLASTRIYLDVLSRRLKDGDLVAAQAQSDRVLSSLVQLGGTLDHLLTAARYDSGAVRVNLDWINAQELILALYDRFSNDALERGVDLRLFVPQRQLQFHSDRYSLERVLSNLISNALKFSEVESDAKSVVLLGVRLHGPNCLVEVIDNGVGIPADQHEAVWQPYRQLDQGKGDRASGIGLGLYLVRRIIDELPAHGISMRSVSGNGTRFTLTLPGRVASAPVALDFASDEGRLGLDPSPLWGASVLLLEDDRNARAAMSALFDDWGMVVSSGATLSELWASYGDSERVVDAIVCDYRLPAGLTGVEALTSIRERLGYSPRAIIMTGESEIASISRLAGPDTIVLQKPVDPDQLLPLLLEGVATSIRRQQG